MLAKTLSKMPIIEKGYSNGSFMSEPPPRRPEYSMANIRSHIRLHNMLCQVLNNNNRSKRFWCLGCIECDFVELVACTISISVFYEHKKILIVADNGDHRLSREA